MCLNIGDKTDLDVVDQRYVKGASLKSRRTFDLMEWINVNDNLPKPIYVDGACCVPFSETVATWVDGYGVMFGQYNFQDNRWLLVNFGGDDVNLCPRLWCKIT